MDEPCGKWHGREWEPQQVLGGDVLIHGYFNNPQGLVLSWTPTM